jgi:hypothetical protein
MMRAGVWMFVCSWIVAIGSTAYAQETPTRIGPYVVDVRGIVPLFGSSAATAASRNLSQAELPGAGFGGSFGGHVYLPKLGPITVGVGVEATVGRSRSAANADVDPPLRAVTETFRSVVPQLSLNFKGANGWSYLSVGFGRARWSVVPDGSDPVPADHESLKLIDYGGGARWFIKKHLAFNLDVRWHEIKEGAPQPDLPPSPHNVILAIGAGVSLR